MYLLRLTLLLYALPFLFLRGAVAQERPLRMAQVHVFEAKSIEELRQEVASLADAGFNAISVRLFQNLNDSFHGLVRQQEDAPFTGVYFHSTRAPVVADLLSPLVLICQDEGIQLYGWMTSRTMDWLDMPAAADAVYSENSPDYISPGNRFDLFDSGFLSYLTALYSELAKYPLAGIIVQDDLVIKTREGLTEKGLAPFAASVGYQGSLPSLRNALFNDSKLFNQWAVYRRDRVLAVLKVLQDLVTDPAGLELGYNVYPDTVLDRRNGLHWLSQDVYALSQAPPARVLLMAYFSQLANELELTSSQAAELTRSLVDEMGQRFGKRLIVKYQITDWTSGEMVDPELFRIFGDPERNIALVPIDTSDDTISRAGELLKLLTADRQN